MNIANSHGTFTVNVGTMVRLEAGYLPDSLDGTQVAITKIEGGYPHFFDGSQHSAISTELITEAIG